jgi:hypothetical protein
MNRLKQLFAAAALAVAGGATLTVALSQEAAVLGMDCQEYRREFLRQVKRMPKGSAYLAFEQGYDAPTVIDDKIIGECGGGSCYFPFCHNDDPSSAFSYRYSASSAAGGWRIAKLTKVPTYLIGAWKDLAATTSSVRFFNGVAEAAQKCIDANIITNAQCLQLFRDINDCFQHKTNTDQTCLNGRLYSDTSSGDQFCSPNGQWRIIDCERGLDEAGIDEVYSGEFCADDECSSKQKFWRDEDLELPDT